MFGKISVCSMAILLPISGILGQSAFGSIVSVVKDPGERKRLARGNYRCGFSRLVVIW